MKHGEHIATNDNKARKDAERNANLSGKEYKETKRKEESIGAIVFVSENRGDECMNKSMGWRMISYIGMIIRMHQCSHLTNPLY